MTGKELLRKYWAITEGTVAPLNKEEESYANYITGLCMGRIGFVVFSEDDIEEWLDRAIKEHKYLKLENVGDTVDGCKLVLSDTAPEDEDSEDE